MSSLPIQRHPFVNEFHASSRIPTVPNIITLILFEIKWTNQRTGSGTVTPTVSSVQTRTQG